MGGIEKMTTASVAQANGGVSGQLARLPDFLNQAINDPGHTSLRRGLRAGVVAPSLLATAALLGLPQSVTIYLIFAVLGLLVFADFGGKTGSRVLAYLVATLVGLPLIAIGTLASPNVWIAVATSLLVGFTIAEFGVLGGYFVSAQTPLMLAFVLAVTNPAAFDTVPERLIGWTAGGLVSAVAGWLLWPRSGHVVLRSVAASVIRTFADIAATADRGNSNNRSSLVSGAGRELAKLRKGFVAAQRRPSGATRSDRALAELATELERALNFATTAAPDDGPEAESQEAAALRDHIVSALRASAALLEGGRDTHNIEPLVGAQDVYRVAVERWVEEQVAGGVPAESILDRLVAAHGLRVLSMAALAIAQNAEVVAGLPTTGPAGDVNLRGVMNTFAEEITPRSISARSSLRTALGVALAVFVARSLDLSYAFWVVLGTLSALRSNVSATGRTAALALGGTALGVLIAVPFVGVTGGEPWILWIVLPVLVFLAAYAPTAINFVVGQVAFSLLVVVLFNILAPTGWRIGLLRVEDAALGVGISLAVGLLLWPRGARGQLRSALAGLYDASASSLSFSFRRVLTDSDESPEAAHTARNIAQTEAIRAEEVFEQFLKERSSQAPSIDTWARLLSSGKSLLLIGDAVDWYVEHGYAAPATGTPAIVLGSLASDAIANLVRLAEEIRTGTPLRVATRRDTSDELRGAAVESLSQAGQVASPTALHSAIGLVSTATWLGQLIGLLQDIEGPVAETMQTTTR